MSRVLGEEEPRDMSMELGVVNSDEFAESVLTVHTPKWQPNPGVNVQDHAKITRILATIKEIIDTSKLMAENERQLRQGQSMMDKANGMFGDLKQWMQTRHLKQQAAMEGKDSNDMRTLRQKKYSGHDIQTTKEDEGRAVDIVRKMFETYTTFPECLEQKLENCLLIINNDLGNLGMSTMEVVVHEKRNVDQVGYNRVVIVTNSLCDRVVGRAGDGYVTYPFAWNEAGGERMLGVDGKWNCHDLAPEDCCSSIKMSAPGQDLQGNNIECHIFVPFGGIGNPRRNDRVFVNLSPDGRVHEPPIVQ